MVQRAKEPQKKGGEKCVRRAHKLPGFGCVWEDVMDVFVRGRMHAKACVCGYPVDISAKMRLPVLDTSNHMYV